MMKSIVYALFFLSGVCLSQEITVGNARSFQDMQIGTVFKEVPIDGTAYMDEMYKMGTTTVNGKEIQLLMRYDAYRDQIEMIDQKQKKFNLLRRSDLEANFDGKTYKFLHYVEKGNKKKGYFIPLNEGRVVLYLKQRKIFIQAEKPDHGYDEYVPPRFITQHGYYIQKKGQPLEEIRLGKGPLLKYMRDKSDAVKSYISEHNLKLNKEEDVVTLLNYYHSLEAF